MFTAATLPRVWFCRCHNAKLQAQRLLVARGLRPRRVAALNTAKDDVGQESNVASPPSAARASGKKASNAPTPPEIQEERFEAMFEQLMAWREQFYECMVPRQAFDGGDLGEWVHKLRRLQSQGKLPEVLQARLDAVGFAWKVDPVTAKWYHNLHVVRRYKALHGTAEIPPDYANPEEPDFVEAARWLERQQDLYQRQKLLRVRVRLLKETLGIKLHRAYAPTRRNLHPVIRREDAKFQAELDRRAQQAQQAGGQAQPEDGGATQQRPPARRQEGGAKQQRVMQRRRAQQPPQE